MKAQSGKRRMLFLLMASLLLGMAGCSQKELPEKEVETSRERHSTEREREAETQAGSRGHMSDDGSPEGEITAGSAKDASDAADEPAVQSPGGETAGPEAGGAVAASEYLLPDSSREYVLWEDIKDMDESRLKLARNEIYARHGRRFQTREIQEYFDGMSWYQGAVIPEDFSENLLSPIEQVNVSYLKSCEEGLKGRLPRDTWFYQIINEMDLPPEYEIYKDSLVDCGDYYQVDAVICQNDYIPFKEYEAAGDGETVNMVVDVLTGRTEEVTLDKTPGPYGDYPIDNSRYGYKNQDRLYVAYYEDGGYASTSNICGTRLFIRKDAFQRIFPRDEDLAVTPETLTSWYSDIIFDNQGFVVRMESMYS